MERLRATVHEHRLHQQVAEEEDKAPALAEQAPTEEPTEVSRRLLSNFEHFLYSYELRMQLTLSTAHRAPDSDARQEEGPPTQQAGACC